MKPGRASKRAEKKPGRATERAEKKPGGSERTEGTSRKGAQIAGRV